MLDVFGIKAIGVLCTSTIVFFLQKKFGNEEQGFYGVVSNSILLFTVLCQFGIPSFTSLQISINKKYNRSKVQKIIGRCIKALLVIQPIFLPLIVYQSYNILFDWYYCLLFSTSIFLNVFIYFFAYILRGFNHYGWMIFLTESLRWLIILILLFSFNNVVEIQELIVHSIFTASLITFCVGFYRVRHLGFNLMKSIHVIKPKSVKGIVISSSAFVLSSFGVICLQQMNIIQLSYYRPLNDVGLFNFTYKYLAFSIIPVSVISAKYAQIASEYFFQDKKEKVKKLLTNVTVVSFSITIISILLLYLVSQYVYFYVNQVFDIKLYIILGFSMFTFSIYGFWISFLVMVKKAKLTSIVLMIAVFSNLIINAIITPKYSYIGTAISDLASNLIALALCSYILINFSILERGKS